MVKSEEILTCLIFIVIGYLIAMIFSRMCSCGNGFSVGGQIDCAQFTDRGEQFCTNYLENNMNPCIWRHGHPRIPPRVEVPARDPACVNLPVAA